MNNKIFEKIETWKLKNWKIENYKCTVDLVTHDNLTPEASSESIERIRRLSELWKQNYTLRHPKVTAPLSSKIAQANSFEAMVIIYRLF